MYTIESLKECNLAYDREHGVIQWDVDKINELKALLEKELSCAFKAGIIVVCKGEKKTYENAHLDDLNYLGQYGCHICMNAGVHVGFLNGTKEKFGFSTSGGYFISEEDTTKFKFTGKTRLKRFWTWGHCGARGNGGIYFEAEVGIWEYESYKIY